MATDQFEKVERTCPRRGCGETIEAYPETIDLSVEMHLANDHGPPEEQPGWPQGGR